MLELKRMRLALELTQLDCYVGCGVSPARLSKAENGHIELTHTEMVYLRDFLRESWERQQQRERVIFASQEAVPA